MEASFELTDQMRWPHQSGRRPPIEEYDNSTSASFVPIDLRRASRCQRDPFGARVLDVGSGLGGSDPAAEQSVAVKVRKLCDRFPIYTDRR